MRILVIAPTPFFSDRGCHIRILEELIALDKLGFTLRLFTYHLGRDIGPTPIYRSRQVSWYRKTSAGPAWPKLYLDALLLWRILRTTKRRDLDLIHAHLHEGGWIGWWLRCWFRKPLLLDLQGSLVDELESYDWLHFRLLRWCFAISERWIITRANHIIVSSQACYNLIQRRWPNLTSRLTLVADAVNSQRFQNNTQADRTRLARELGLKPHQPCVVYSGGLTPAKGIDTLLHAIPYVSQQLPLTQFLIIGYPEIERCRAIVEQLRCSAAVRFAGQIAYDQLPKYLALGNVAVDPKPTTSTESSGKLLNYMAAGLPVVAFASINTQAMLGATGRLVTDQSPQALAQAIVAVLQQPELAARLGSKAQQRVQAKFDWSQRVHQITTLYAKLSR